MGLLSGLIKGAAGFFTGNPALMASAMGDFANPKNDGKGGTVTDLATSFIPGGDTAKNMPGLSADSNKPAGMGVENMFGMQGQLMKNRKKALQNAEVPAQEYDDSVLQGMVNDVPSFDLTDNVPQYANGGIANNGDPAVIIDPRTGRPVGTMNENGAEYIVPADLVPQATRNMTVDPQLTQSGIDMAKVGSPTPSQSLAVMPDKEEILNLTQDDNKNLDLTKDLPNKNVNPDNKPVDTNKTNDPNSSESSNEFNLFNTIKAISPLLRIIGYTADARRQNLGMGARKGMITNVLDWVDNQDKFDKQLTIKKTTKGTDLDTYEKKKAIDAKYRKAGGGSGSGNKYTVSSAVDDLDKAMFGKRSIDGSLVPGSGIENATSAKDAQAVFDAYSPKFKEYHPDLYQELEKSYKNRLASLYDEYLKENKTSDSDEAYQQFLEQQGLS